MSLSIIIVNYKSEKFIYNCIKSALEYSPKPIMKVPNSPRVKHYYFSILIVCFLTRVSLSAIIDSENPVILRAAFPWYMRMVVFKTLAIDFFH